MSLPGFARRTMVGKGPRLISGLPPQKPFFAITLISFCGQVTKFHSSLERSEARSYLWNFVHHKRTIGLTRGKISLANGEMGEDKDSHKCNHRPDQDHHCEPSLRLSFKMLRKFLHLLSGFLASDGWTLGSCALGEGSSKDTRSGFTPHGTRKSSPNCIGHQKHADHDGRVPYIERHNKSCEKSPDAVQHGPDLELQIHWFRLHLEKGNKNTNE